jgi:hypothetical protein
MSNKKVEPSELFKNELAKSAFFTKDTNPKVLKIEEENLPNDVMKSRRTDVIDQPVLADHIINTDSSRGLNRKSLSAIITAILNASTNVQNTPIRLTNTEKGDMEDFILTKLRNKGVSIHKLSLSKLMRICTRYMIKVHEEELLNILAKSIEAQDDFNI